MSDSKPSLAGRRAVVTGGSRGIGAAIARLLAVRGAEVAITYSSSREAAETVVASLRESGSSKATAVRADASNPAEVSKAIAGLADHLGGIDILVNNAGVFAAAPLTEMRAEDFERTMTVNVSSVMAATKAAVSHMGEGGRIISIGSVNADWLPMPGLTAYAASKAAVEGMTLAWAREFGERGITANCVRPGPVDTEMNPADGPFAEVLTGFTALKRYGRVEEVASLVGFLASSESSYLTGSLIDVDGGIRV